MNTRQQFDFQSDLPVFVRAIPAGMEYLKFSGRKYTRGQHLPWKELGMKYETVKLLMDQHILHHNESRTVEQKVGDGLDMMTYEEIEALVEKINEKVKANTQSQNDYNKYKVKRSRIRDKQIGLLRSWRRNYGKFESM